MYTPLISARDSLSFSLLMGGDDLTMYLTNWKGTSDLCKFWNLNFKILCSFHFYALGIQLPCREAQARLLNDEKPDEKRQTWPAFTCCFCYTSYPFHPTWNINKMPGGIASILWTWGRVARAREGRAGRDKEPRSLMALWSHYISPRLALASEPHAVSKGKTPQTIWFGHCSLVSVPGISKTSIRAANA